jgi:hypothetical protein
MSHTKSRGINRRSTSKKEANPNSKALDVDRGAIAKPTTILSRVLGQLSRAVAAVPNAR